MLTSHDGIPEISSPDLDALSFEEMCALATWDLSAAFRRGAHPRVAIDGRFEMGDPDDITYVSGRVLRTGDTPERGEWEILRYLDAGLRVFASAGPRTTRMPILRSMLDTARAAWRLRRELPRISNLPGRYRQEEFQRLAHDCNMSPTELLAHLSS